MTKNPLPTGNWIWKRNTRGQYRFADYLITRGSTGSGWLLFLPDGSCRIYRTLADAKGVAFDHWTRLPA